MIVKQAREAFNGGLLIAKPACQCGLVGGLFFNDRGDEINYRLQLMTVRPRQKRGDIISQTSSRRFFVCHKTNFPQVNNLLLLVYLQYVFILQAHRRA